MAILGLAKSIFKDLYYSPVGMATSRLARAALGLDRAIYRRHRQESGAAKLHIGCGDVLLKGWLNCDRKAVSRDVYFLDGTRPFPFGKDEFDYAFCEHMIEHISYAAAARMVAEVHRVLKPGGKFRLVTPGLEFLVDLFRRPDDPLHREYIEYNAKKWVPEAPTPRAAFVINNFVRAWGHTFIYDEPTLIELLQRAGFRNVVKVELNRSEDPALAGLENVERMPPGFLVLESLAVEGTK